MEKETRVKRFTKFNTYLQLNTGNKEGVDNYTNIKRRNRTIIVLNVSKNVQLGTNPFRVNLYHILRIYNDLR